MADLESTYPDGAAPEPGGAVEVLPPPGDAGATGHRVNSDGLTVVDLPSGQAFPVQTDDEADYLVDRIGRYHKDNRLTNISDLADLDRLLILEMLVYRWQFWVSTGTDYQGRTDDINEVQLRKSIKDFSLEIRQLKAQLGIDKSSRDRSKGEDSVSEYLIMLKQRAREFGVHRDEQVAKLYELGNQLIAMIIWHDNCSPEERVELGITREDLFDWIRNIYITEFRALDTAFRLNQRIYIRQM